MSAAAALASDARPTVRALPTPHDPPAGPVTVATPSCCCCCCCCLNSIGAAVGFSIGATTETARTHGRPSLVPTLLAVGAGPLAITVLVALRAVAELVLGEGGSDGLVGQVIGATGAGAYVGSFAVAIRLAGGGWSRAIGVPVVSLLAVVPLVAIEVFAALFTSLLVELLVPAAVLLGIHAGRKAYEVPASSASSAGSAGPAGPWPVPADAWSPPLLPPPVLPPSPAPPAAAAPPPEAPGLPQLPSPEAPSPGSAAPTDGAP